MEKLRKQINQSFFNPILHILPLPVFLVVEEYFGIGPGWLTAFPVALFLLLYTFFKYNNIFGWHILFQGFFITAGILSSVCYLIPLPEHLRQLSLELILLCTSAGMLLFRKQIQKAAKDLIPHNLPMSNNFRETNRFITLFLILLALYLLSNLAIIGIELYQDKTYNFSRNAFITILIGLLGYEFIRVKIVRAKLCKEEWWPIVTKQGKIIGSIQHLTSLNDQNKYMHPVAHVMIIDRGMILLHQHSHKSQSNPGLWDTVITDHIRMGESIEQCIERSAKNKYKLSDLRYMFLSNYIHEAEKEFQYAFLFVSCQKMAYDVDPTHTQQLKWWTQHQIEENLNSGIFPESFKIEYDLLKRSGLIESGKCHCNCRLKEVIAEQSQQVIKIQVQK